MSHFCMLCGSDEVYASSVILDILQPTLTGLVHCKDCAYTGLSMHEALLQSNSLLYQYKSFCGYCYHFKNPYGRGCHISRIAAPVVQEGKQGFYEVDHSNDLACEDFTSDGPGKHCIHCIGKQPHLHVTDLTEALKQTKLRLTGICDQHSILYCTHEKEDNCECLDSPFSRRNENS